MAGSQGNFTMIELTRKVENGSNAVIEVTVEACSQENIQACSSKKMTVGDFLMFLSHTSFQVHVGDESHPGESITLPTIHCSISTESPIGSMVTIPRMSDETGGVFALHNPSHFFSIDEYSGSPFF